MAISTLDLLVIALSAWRLAFMLVKEDGPGDVFGRLRRLVGVRQKLADTPGGQQTPYGLNVAADLFCCVYCMSVWTAALSWGLLQTSAAPVAYILAASGLALMLQRYVGFDHS